MSDVNLNSGITLHSLVTDIAVPAFLAVHPMPQIPDPDTGLDVDEYASTKLYVEAWLKDLQKRKLLKEINKGIDILNRKSTQAYLKEL